MVTSKERQEIADKLRAIPKKLKDECFYDGSCWYNIEQELFRMIYEIVFSTSKDGYNGIFTRLADLIDSTCKICYTDTSTNTPDTGYEPDGYYYCSNCSGELDSPLDEMWDTYQANDYEGEPPFEYCPYCGARVLTI